MRRTTTPFVYRVFLLISSIVEHVRNALIVRILYFLKLFSSFRFLVFGLSCNFFLLLSWQLNSLPAVAGTNWVDKALAILNFDAPADNYYPPGSGLLITPFVNFPHVSLLSTFFWANIGFIFYFLICNFISSKFWNLVALFTFLINVYLFWNFKSSQDTVFEFAFVMISVYFLIRQNWYIAFLSLFLLFQIRSGYLLLFVLVFGLILIRRNYFNVKKRMLIFPIGLFILSASFNQLVYGVVSPSVTSGQTIYFGQNKYFYLGHPNFDIDTFLSKEGHMTPKGFANEELLSRGLREIDDIFLNQALNDIRNNPQVLIQNTLTKIDNLFFNFQKIPNLPGQHWLSTDANSIIIDKNALDLKYAIGNLIYFIYRVISVLLIIYALSVYFHLRKLMTRGDYFHTVWLLLPFISWVPLCLIFYEDTRFRIVSESLFLPASAYLITRLNTVRISNSQLPIQN